MKILPVGTELFHADGRTDRLQTDMRKLIVLFLRLKNHKYKQLFSCKCAQIHCVIISDKFSQSLYWPGQPLGPYAPALGKHLVLISVRS